MRGRRLWAAKLLLTAPFLVFLVLLVLASTGVLPFWAAVVSAAALVALSWRFRRWEADDVARRPFVPLGGASPELGEVVPYAPWSSRLLVTTVPAVAGSVAIVLLLVNEIPAWRLVAAPLA